MIQYANLRNIFYSDKHFPLLIVEIDKYFIPYPNEQSYEYKS